VRGVVPEQLVELGVQATQALFRHTGVPPVQFVLAVHWTQVFVPVLHTGLAAVVHVD
jgi:hypothetical protein